MRQSSASSHTTTSGETDKSDEEERIRFDNFEAGWKTVFLLQFQPQFEAVIMIGIYFSYISILQRLKRQYFFQNVKSMVMKRLASIKVKDYLLYQTFETFFILYWKNKKGFRFKNDDVKIIPEIMAREISLDICWDLLKHSHLFRRKETHFLRHIAPLLKQKFLIPGEAIYKRNKFKNAMFYVVTGVIQILSEEDSETPILSFSGGTCIGESTLLIDYPSTCSVVCQSYCEVYALYKKDFINISHSYPEQYRSMLKEVKVRYLQAREYQDILDFSYDGTKQKREVLILKWIKMTLHELLAKDIVAVGKYKKTLSLEDRHMMKELEKLIFCCKHLDMLVITEQIELVTDSVFLQTTCPCILQPGSFIVVTWYNIVAVAIFIFAFIYPYYAVFQPKISKVYIIFSYIISFLWGLDIYINLSTAIKTKDGIITDISSIAIQKVGDIEFFLDIFAAVPFELFALLVLGTVGSQFYVLLQAPRLLKMYKIAHFFDGTIAGVGVTSRCFLKYTIYMVYVMYYTAATFHLRLCYKYICKEEDNIFINFIEKMAKGSVFNTAIAWINISSQLLTNIAIKIPAEGKLDSLYPLLILGEIVATLFYIFFLASTSVTHALRKFNILKLREYATSIKLILNNLGVKPLLYNQVVSHLRGQMTYNEGIDLLYSPEFYSEETHPILVKETRKLNLLHILREIPLFTDLPDELLSNFAEYFHPHLLVPGEVIAYAGEVCKEMHIILDGYCEVVGDLEKDIQVIGPGKSISVIEMCFGIPIARTIITQTHCKLISLKHSKFIQAHQMYPEVLLDLKVVIHTLTQTTNFQAILSTDNINLESRIMKEHYASSFKVFGYHLDPDTKQGADYHGYFDKLGFFGFLRYIFPRYTIKPYGKFLLYWEISRCVFAFLTAVISPVAVLSTCENCAWKYFLYFLDITAWLDICIKHYICYFDEKGIEVTHPLKTVSYYWKHGFILDFLGVFPFDTILTPKVQLEHRNKARVLLKMIRLLQTYRIFSAINYFDKQSMTPSKIWTTIKFLPIVIIFASTFGSLIINIRCQFNDNIKAEGIFENGVSCQLGTWVTETKGRKPLSPIRTHLYGLFVTLVMLTGPGVGGFSAQNIQEGRNMVVISSIGYLFFMYITSKIVATNLFRNSDLTAYQEEMRHLVKFLSCERIDIRLRKEIIEHFEYVWLKRKGKDLHKIIKCFNYALQEDILLDVYGTALKKSTIFSAANDSFFRSLLLNVKHEIIMKRGIVLKVNDVHNELYIVYKGKVEVLGPDYNRLLVLRVGSIFGNIDDCERSRQTLTMVAKGHVELLSIPTAAFHQILSNYSKLRNHYHQLTAVNTDYLVGAESSAIYGDSYTYIGDLGSKSHHSITSAKSKSSYKASGLIGTLKQQLPARLVWDHIFLVAICYFGCVVEFFQVTVHGNSFYTLGILYALDILFFIHIYLNFRTPYANEYGVLVYDKKQIALHYIKDPLGFPLHLASVIPLELIVIFFMKSGNAWLIWSFCRSNRFIKVYYVIEYFHKKNQQLNINVNFMRTIFLLVWISLLLQALTCILIIATCLDPPNSVSPPVKCDWDTMKSDERYDLYAYTFSILLYFFTATGVPEYFPNAAIVIFLVIVLLIIIRTVMTFFISEIATTLDITLNSRLKYEYNIQTLREHMVRERISPALLDRIWLYIKLLWKMHHGLQFPPLLEEAPYYLREAVLNSMFGYHLRKHALFRVCHIDMIRQIAAQLRTRVFYPGDYITFINDIDGCMYFIHEGSVDCLSEEDMYSERIEKILNKGEMFGFEQGTYTDCGHEYTYRANRHTIILVLERKKWIHLLDFFPASKRLIYITNR
ncbi:hypothetical protein ILUMI_06607 [Ignelater luminosus]|uniref:Uncharacterized protein n=1 Tax=Ignelater luminosus TaxID=2038154 RepID=A0A8K0D4Z4_IGNLU|nr:hypothetical protein ILUMI_06607 [Ignelater luminosus]